MVRTSVTKKAGVLKLTLPKLNPPAEKEAGMEGVEVRVVLTVRNKTKKRLLEGIEDGWEYFINGIGKGITVQLVGEEIDPGEIYYMIKWRDQMTHIFLLVFFPVYVSREHFSGKILGNITYVQLKKEKGKIY